MEEVRVKELKQGKCNFTGSNRQYCNPAVMVSVVIAVYNGEKHLEQTIQSIINQSYKNIELLVIDGGSTDGTVKILEKYNPNISYWLSEPDKGIYSAWNKAIAIATGQWICFIGSDDVLLPHAIESYMQYIDDNDLHNYDFVSSVIQLTNENLNPVRSFGRAWQWQTHKVEMRVAHVGAMHNKNLFNTYGFFDEKFKIAGDYELLLRPKDQLKASFMEVNTVLMRYGGASNTSTKVFHEALQAKIASAKRNILICNIECFYLLFKFYFLKLIR